jgi:replicative DNA helicase
MAVDYNKGVAMFSLEMTSDQLVTRLLSSEAEISASNLRKGQLQSYQGSS